MAPPVKTNNTTVSLHPLYFSSPRVAKSQNVICHINSAEIPTPVMSTTKAIIRAAIPLEKQAKNSIVPRVTPPARLPAVIGLRCFTRGDKGPLVIRGLISFTA